MNMIGSLATCGGFWMHKTCVVVCACHLSSGLDEVVPIFLDLIEVSNMVERGVTKYGLYR